MLRLDPEKALDELAKFAPKKTVNHLKGKFGDVKDYLVGQAIQVAVENGEEIIETLHNAIDKLIEKIEKIDFKSTTSEV